MGITLSLYLLGGWLVRGSRYAEGMTHRPTGLSPGLGEFLDFDGADVRALVGDGEGAAYEESFLGDDVIGPGLDGGIRDVILRVEQRDGLRLSVVEQEFDFKRAFHGEDSFRGLEAEGVGA